MANSKPSDLFVGLVDFFAVLLPGAVLTFALQLAEVRFLQLLLANRSREAKWIAFVVASYLLGHFVFLIGAAFLDDLYDAAYAKWRYAGRGSRLLRHVGAIKRGVLQDAHRIENHFKWARAFVKLNKPEAAVDIDRLEADSKFFRGLIVVAAAGWAWTGVYKQAWAALLLSASLSLVWIVGNYIPGKSWKTKHPRFQAGRRAFKRLRKTGVIAIYQYLTVAALILGAISSEGRWWLVIGCFLVMCLSAWRYADQRWKMTQTAYLYFAMLNQSAKTSPDQPIIFPL